MDADARRAGRVAGDRATALRRRAGARTARTSQCGSRRPQPLSDLSVRVRRRASSRSKRPSGNGRTFRMFHRETDAAKVARNRDAIFDLHAVVARLARATTPASRIRGASSTSCSCRRSSSAAWSTPARSSTTPRRCCSIRRATQNQKLGRASLIAHETAHMWFGDLVTMRWFDDVWMKEVFANFMAAKIVNPAFPADQPRPALPLAHYPSAYDVDRTAGHERDPPAARQPATKPARSTARSSTRRRRSSCVSSRRCSASDSLPRRAARISDEALVRATPPGPI